MTLGEFRKKTEHLPDDATVLGTCDYDNYGGVRVKISIFAFNEQFGYYYDLDDNVDNKDPEKTAVLIKI